MFDHISKHLEVRQKYPAARRIFNSLLGVWKCGQTLSFVFDILRTEFSDTFGFCPKLKSSESLGQSGSDVNNSFSHPIKVSCSSNISNRRDSVLSGYTNTEKRVENTTRSGVFMRKFDVFG